MQCGDATYEHKIDFKIAEVIEEVSKSNSDELTISFYQASSSLN